MANGMKRAFCFALAREARLFRKRFPQARVEIVGVAGSRIPEDCDIIIAGYGGALRSDLRLGDSIVAREVIDEHRNVIPLHVPEEWKSLPQGRLLTWSRILGIPAEKRDIGRQYQADVVDMETAEIARLCHARGMKCSALRAISDEADHEVSQDILAIFDGGNISPVRLASVILRKPSMIRELVKLQRATNLADKSLAQTLGLIV